MKNADQPINSEIHQKYDDGSYEYKNGLTKREYFAGLAMQAFLSNSHDAAPRMSDDVCKRAVLFADELLKQLAL